MRIVRRAAAAVALGLGVFIAPGAIHAGGGGGIGGGGIGGLVVNIDHLSPPGHNWGYLDYFSRNVTVQQGGVVTWQLANFTEPHTVTILPGNIPFGPQSQAAFNRLFPGAQGGLDSDDAGAAGKNFALPVNYYVSHGCGNSPYAPGTGPCSYTGSGVVNSGFLVNGPQGRNPHFSVRINAAPGVYHYFCLIHGPAMNGTITVVPAGRPADTQLSVNRRAATQAFWGTRNALAYESHFPAPRKTVGGHPQWTVFTGGEYGRVAINEFIPRTVAAKVGDTVAWTPGFHTVTFPASTAGFVFDPSCENGSQDFLAFPPPRWSACNNLELAGNALTGPSGATGKAYTGGFYNSGVLVLPSPRPWSASFPKGGTFTYRCVVHPGMIGVIKTG